MMQTAVMQVFRQLEQMEQMIKKKCYRPTKRTVAKREAAAEETA